MSPLVFPGTEVWDPNRCALCGQVKPLVTVRVPPGRYPYRNGVDVDEPAPETDVTMHCAECSERFWKG